MSEPREPDLFTLPFEFACDSSERFSLGGELLWSEGAFQGLHLRFDFLAQIAIRNGGQVWIEKLLWGARRFFGKPHDLIVRQWDERLPVFRMNQCHHCPGDVARQIDALAIDQAGPALQFSAQSLPERFFAGVAHRAYRNALRYEIIARRSGLRILQQLVAAFYAVAIDLDQRGRIAVINLGVADFTQPRNRPANAQLDLSLDVEEDERFAGRLADGVDQAFRMVSSQSATADEEDAHRRRLELLSQSGHQLYDGLDGFLGGLRSELSVAGASQRKGDSLRIDQFETSLFFVYGAAQRNRPGPFRGEFDSCVNFPGFG